jgi:hypothetical protein
MVVESCPFSCRLVLLDLNIDLFSMPIDVPPRADQVRGAKCRITGQDLCVARPQLPQLLKHPHRNSSADNARLAAANSSRLLDHKQGTKGMLEGNPTVSPSPNELFGKPNPVVLAQLKKGLHQFFNRGHSLALQGADMSQ